MQILKNLSSKAACRLLGGTFDLALSRFPAVVRIETTNACNGRCLICPHGAIKRPIQRMDEGLFTRIIDECAARGCKEVHLHNFGEPLLDEGLEDRIRYAKQRGLPKVKIFSNGSLVDGRRARGLIEAGLDEIKISVDGASREEFERIRAPLRFDEVIENIVRLVALRNQLRSPMRIELACCATGDRRASVRALERLADGVVFGRIHNWAGDGAANGAGRVRKPCARLWRTLTVLANGEVALCCLDYDGQCVLGRIDAETPIGHVWRGAAYREVRLRHKQSRQAEIPLCRNCSKSFV